MQNWAVVEACLCFTRALQGWAGVQQSPFRGEQAYKTWHEAKGSNQQLLELRNDKLKAIPQNVIPKLVGKDLNPVPGMSLSSLCRWKWEGKEEVKHLEV